jgi:uncharacterized repeat protein (TIGR01451 family)
MRRALVAGVAILICGLSSLAAGAQPLTKSAINVDPGNTKQTGQQFGYRLSYNCSSTSGPCLNAEVDDLLPASVQFLSTVPATAPTGDVTAINVTPNYMATGRTRVQFVLVSPLPAGNSGDLLINVRFPSGTTPNGTQAVNTADGINLGATPGTFTTPPVTVTAVVPPLMVSLTKSLITSPATLDLLETYRLRISVSGGDSSSGLTAVGPVVDTPQPGTVFQGATPAADCEPTCVGTVQSTITWTAPCAVPVLSGNSCDILVNVTFPSATFTSGDPVTNIFKADGTRTGQPPGSLGMGQVSHSVTAPTPNATLSKTINGNSANPPTLNQTFTYDLSLSNSGTVPLDNLVVIDDVPLQLQITSVTTGSYSGLSDFAAGVGVRVSYEKNTALGVFTLWGSSPSFATNTTLTAPPPGLGAGEYITRIRWEYGQAAVGMGTGQRPQVTGRIINPDNAGAPVPFGTKIDNCADLMAVYTAGSTTVSRKDVCASFNLSGPFVQLTPSKSPSPSSVNPGDPITWNVQVRSASQSSDPAPLEGIVATDLLPVDLLFSSWSFNDQGTGLPAPQSFQQIPNFAGTGRTLLIWRWSPGSGSLAAGQAVRINLVTTLRNSATFGSLANDFTLDDDTPGLVPRCTPSQTDALDYDGDGDTTETLCRATGTVTVNRIANLKSEKTIQGTCDGGSVTTSAGTLTGGALHYKLHVENKGTMPMQNFVLVDILPFVGDTGVRDTTPRGSQWTPLLVAPITPPPGTVISYSTSGNPCRGEVSGPTTSCDPPNWTTVPPDPITSVRSFKVEFGSHVVNPGDALDFFFSMTTPGDVAPGTFAYNSFAYQANRADGLGPLTAEPQKVGITLGTCDAAALGDFVWVDANKNGIQDDGPTGLNGVYVRLFTPGADGVPGTPDDVPLSSTVTGNGPGGAPGWYRFPGLAPGSYFVCFTPPPTFQVTAQHVGAGASDSDANPLNGCTPVVTLAANQDDPDVDAGLIATQLAALGDYVWFDRNSDGLQNESPSDGANGVTVKLFLDDGDGNPEPGTGDVQVASTVTADDVYGRPGYYLFDGLIPGLHYFVQFVRPASATAFTTQTAGSDATIDSNPRTSDGATAEVTLAPGEVNRTIDAGLVAPTGNLSLGDQVWMDSNINNDGIFQPQNGEMGIDGVRLDLYADVNGDGKPTLDEYRGTTTTFTEGGFAGRYHFNNLAPGTYIVVVNPASFGGGGALSGKVSSTGNDPAPDPDDDVNGDDNGTAVGALTASLPVTLTSNGEPTSEDGNANTNLTVDFGFIASAGPQAQPRYDYGDAPDVAAGTTRGDYNTTALDLGAAHLLGVPNTPYLGSCVDADGGFNQDPTATGDDVTTSDLTIGTCATPGDDEDGVTFTGPFTPGSAAQFTITSGGPTACVLNAWVDWNQNGVFGDSPGEQIAADLTVSTSTVLSPTVPAGAVPGLTYARFRCSSGTGLGPTGLAADGEVEDYLVGVIGTDFGDAPPSYGTQGAGAASHVVNPLVPLTLGTCVDTEPDGQPNGSADGDDNTAGTSRVGSCFDDEDGVTFLTPLAACQTAQLTVTASAAGKLDAWIDFNADGDFNDAGEQVFTSQTLAAGANPLSFNVPCAAAQAATYARFRLSSAGGLGPTGAAPDGEVEDYAVNIGNVDFGDAPDSYGTLLASNGPNHRVVTGFFLGSSEDSETDGQPSAAADGDGADENGVFFPNSHILIACSTVTVPVTYANAPAFANPRLDAWIDFDGDGHFDDPRDRIANNLALPPTGILNLTVNVPCDAKPAFSYARFRLSSTGVASPLGPAPDGEVEDYTVQVDGLDFGDAPAPYPTLLANDGARHAVAPGNNPTLGSLVDTEGDGQPSATLTGDDANGVDDEDGVTFPSPLIPGTDGTIQLRTGAMGGIVICWIDFNRNGSWADAGEQVVPGIEIFTPNTTRSLTFPVPVGSLSGNAPVRCRISTQGALGVTGFAPDGEVEDHLAPVGVEQPMVGAAKKLVSVERQNGTLYQVVFEIQVANFGNVPLTNVQVTESLSTTFAQAASFSVVSVQSAELTVNPAFDGAGDTNLLAAGNTLAVGAGGKITLTLRIDSGGHQGPYTNQVQASAKSPANVMVMDPSQNGMDADPNHNGDPTDNNDPTVFILPLSIIEVPTLGTWGLLALALLLGGVAVWRMRRRVAE